MCPGQTNSQGPTVSGHVLPTCYSVTPRSNPYIFLLSPESVICLCALPLDRGSLRAEMVCQGPLTPQGLAQGLANHRPSHYLQNEYMQSWAQLWVSYV